MDQRLLANWVFKYVQPFIDQVMGAVKEAVAMSLENDFSLASIEEISSVPMTVGNVSRFENIGQSSTYTEASTVAPLDRWGGRKDIL